MFSLESQPVKLTHVNLRLEKHGDQDVLSCDLKFEAKASNDILSEFHPDLKSAFFVKGNPAQGELIEGNPLGELRFAADIPTVRFEHEYVGYAMALVYTGPVSDREERLELASVTIGSIAFEFIRGGSVGLTFRTQGRPETKDVARLAELLGHSCAITLTPPEEPEQKELDADKPLATAGDAERASARKSSRRDARKAAERAFAGE